MLSKELASHASMLHSGVKLTLCYSAAAQQSGDQTPQSAAAATAAVKALQQLQAGKSLQKHACPL
jgi:hypothetical protein